ncbi:MAG: hypothetical protein FWC39_02180 [Bacteroidetes bacterium]|nr:hypothetical protein [Bacteroidota bacterium]
MTNRVFLTRISEKETETLFEAHLIPVFWLTLLSARIVKKLRKEIARNANKEEALLIKIPKQKFIRNTNTGKKYFKEIYTERENLYHDFVKYLDEKFNENDILELNIIELAHRDENTKYLLEDIKDAVEDMQGGFYISNQNIFEPNEGWCGSFVGSDDLLSNQFRSFSAVYAECYEREKAAIELYNLQEAQEKAKKERTRKKDGIFLTVSCGVFVGIGIFILIKDPSELFLAISTIVFFGIGLLVGIWKLKS